MLILAKPYPNSYFELSENITVPEDHVVNTDNFDLYKGMFLQFAVV